MTKESFAQRSCYVKKKYSEKNAHISLVRMLLSRSEKIKNKELLHVYKCEFCGMFHIGHIAKKNKE
jgi:hypothetical protein